MPDLPIVVQPVVPPDAPQYGLQFVPDIDFAEKDPTVIESEVITDYQAAFLALTGIAKALAPGDPVRLLLLSVCAWITQQRIIIDYTGKQNLLKYAAGDNLDNLAALNGSRAVRLQASPALTTLRFTLGAALAFGVSVPAGTLVQGPNGVQFTTLTEGPIAEGDLTTDVAAQATLSGIIGNGFVPGQVNSIINWNQPWSVTVSNLDETSGGTDKETDDQYRYRIWLAIESFSTCGPKSAYEFWALSASPDIIQCVVHSAPEIAGEVWLYPLLRNGEIPGSEILDLVAAACSPNTRRPVTDFVSVFAPTPFEYTLDIDYYIRDTDEVLAGTIQDAVEQAVADWILWQRSAIGRDLNGDELIKRCLEAGAKRVVINSPDPAFQVMDYNQLAVHDEDTEPVISYAGIEES